MASDVGRRTRRRLPALVGLVCVVGLVGLAAAPSSAGSVSSAAGLGFAANARVSANAASLARGQAEPSIASDPLNRNVMVVGYADAASPDAVGGVSRSTDGGKSWAAPSGGALLPNPPGLTWGDRRTVGHVAGGDARLAWGTGNTVYYANLGNQDDTNPPTPGVCDVGGLYVYRSTDGGDTWTVPAGGPAAANTQTIYRDRDGMAADSNPLSSHAGTVYLAWSDDQYTGCPHIFPGTYVTRSIMFSRSTDGGVSWSTPISLAAGCVQAAIPAVGADGSVYVAWFDCNGGAGDRELVRKSSDGGVTFSPAVAAGSGLMRCPDPLPGASFRLAGDAAPTIATDPTSAARVYVAWSSCTLTSQADVFFSRSLDGGATWSPTPLRVNDDGASNPRDQFFPAITVDDQGVVRAMWGDDRLDLVNAGGHFYDIFAAASTDHGASFGTNVRVTTQSSDPDIDNGGTFIGDYFGMAPCGTAVWGDTRNGNQDIFAAGLDQNADGIVDDCVTGPPANTVPPTIGGTAVKGATLNGSPGAWKGFPLPSFTRQWRRCDALGNGCVDIPGATSANYTPVAADAGGTLRFRVTGSNALGSAASDSAQTAVIPLPALMVATTGAGAGAVTSSPSGISCRPTCSHDFQWGAIVTLTAIPAAGSSFSGWSGSGCSGRLPCSLTMSEDQSVTAAFARLCVVPNLKGKALSAARNAARRAHCSLGRVSRAYSSKVRNGRVVSQRPRPGRRLAANAKVDVVISKGKRPRSHRGR
jgi:hypothetical protein